MAYEGCRACGKTKTVGQACPACGKTDAESHQPQWFCTSCGAQTNPVSLSGFNVWVFLILCLIMVLPGVLYAVYWIVSGKSGCPQCRQATLIPLTSPVARAALSATHHGA